VRRERQGQGEETHNKANMGFNMEMLKIPVREQGKMGFPSKGIGEVGIEYAVLFN